MLSTPPLFQLIQSESGTDWKEMYRVFNMGHRMEIYTDEASAHEMIQLAKGFNIEAQIIGRVEESETKKLTITSVNGTFEYYS
jgi:phosphoribosylformylglycinamidine cyclo-ligase